MRESEAEGEERETMLGDLRSRMGRRDNLIAEDPEGQRHPGTDPRAYQVQNPR